MTVLKSFLKASWGLDVDIRLVNRLPRWLGRLLGTMSGFVTLCGNWLYSMYIQHTCMRPDLHWYEYQTS